MEKDWKSALQSLKSGDEIPIPENSKKRKSNLEEENSMKNDCETKNTHLGVSAQSRATAPYNFVPLNCKIIENKDEPIFDNYCNKRNTGYIDIEIKNLTDLYIRDTSIKNERSNEFFGSKNKLRIPGSSIRGMIRNLVEILSFGKFHNTNFEKKFYYRSFADKSVEHANNYKRKMMGEKKIKVNEVNKSGATQLIETGFIRKIGNQYFIFPVDDEIKFYRVEEDLCLEQGILENRMSRPVVINNQQNLNGRTKYVENRNYNENEAFNIMKVKFRSEPESVHENHSRNLYYAKVTDIKLDDDTLEQDWISAYLICTGWMQGRKPTQQNDGSKGKHMHWIINANHSESPLEVPQEVINNYIWDKDRKGINILSEDFSKIFERGVPCFFFFFFEN